MYNLIEYSNNYSKTSGNLWQYYSDEPVLNDNGVINNFPGNTASFKFKWKTTEEIGAVTGAKNNKMIMPLKYLSKFWRTLEMTWINCEINLIPTWPANCVISNAATNQATTFAINDTKLYLPIITLSSQDNAKLLQQLKSGLKRTVDWNKNQSNLTIQEQNQYLDYLIDPSF